MKQYLALGAIALGLAAALPASAASFTFSFDNIHSVDVEGSEDNTKLSFNLGADSFITGMRYEADVEAFAGSWLSELALRVSGRSDEGFDLSPVSDVDESGRRMVSDTLDLLNQGLSFRLGGDGQLRLQFYDHFKDLDGPDGIWHSGRLTFDYVAAPVPEPATWASLMAGLGAVGLMAARRQRRGGGSQPA